jgi:hypothetical protein
MVRAIAAYLDFCYLVRLPTFSESDLAAIDDALERYVQERQIFVDVGVCPKGIFQCLDNMLFSTIIG